MATLELNDEIMERLTDIDVEQGKSPSIFVQEVLEREAVLHNGLPHLSSGTLFDELSELGLIGIVDSSTVTPPSLVSSDPYEVAFAEVMDEKFSPHRTTKDA